MSTLAAYGAAGAGIVRRDVRLYLSYRGRIFSQLLAVFFSISLFYYIAKLVHVGTFQTPVEYFGYVVVGVAILEVLGATLTGLPPMLRQELMAGTFERLVISPTGAVASTVAMLIFPTFVAMLTGTVAICYGVLVFGLPLRGDTAALAIPVAFLAATAFAPFALLIGGLVLAVKRAGTAAGFVVTGLSLVGGFFFPVALLPVWIRWLAQVQPFTPALNLLRNLLIGTPLVEPEWLSVAKLIGFTAVLFPVSVWTLARGVRWAQRRGTIIEY
ncbi:MAG TPA: ABC transporter permease [Gaiellaceae bacterium]